MSQFAHSVLRCTVSGTCWSGSEIWSTSFYIGSVGEDTSNPTQAFADAIRTAWTAFFTSAGSGIGNQWKTDQIKLAQIGTDGKTSLSNVIYAPYGTAITGQNSSFHYPPQVSVAATLAVTGARGLAAKGRMYLPGINAGLQANAQMSSTDAQSIANNVKTFIEAVNAAAPAGEKVILASQGRRTKGADGKYTPVPGTAVNAVVNQVRVGTVFDTQRRRRNGLKEQYLTAAVS